MELARVKRELAIVKMERDILKNATAYFAKESLRVRGDESNAIRAWYSEDVRFFESFQERVLQMAEPEAFQTGPRRGKAGGRDQGRPPEDS